ncbi:uncharacterized protein LOC135683708 [Rhopilema esculentum]|uniref:uncharacterized protein LOC135683708 n=1 Tax=Rhopilema esculentum TaxID=499914 RepID=UPI0031DEE986
MPSGQTGVAQGQRLGFDVPLVQIERESKWEFLENTRRATPKSVCLHRDGPAPKSEAKRSSAKLANGSLDSDVDEDEAGIDGEGSANSSLAKWTGKKGGKKGPSAGSKAFIIYFSKLAHAPETELVDFDFVESLLDGGASVNSTDKHGQSVFHEVARNWHPDVAYFLLQKGANINKADKWGRSPLHSAAAVDHSDMVEFLLQNGANIHAKSRGEWQTPIHYAAKFNAVRSLKVLMDWHANVNDRDYKKRTPLFIAAENAREEATRYLIERGAPAGVFDESGLSAVSLLIEKMPKVAKDALEQFVNIDRAFRKEYYYLGHLEHDPSEWKDLEEFKKHKKMMKKDGIKVRKCPTTPLKVAVRCQEFEILMHPVIQRLISVKWNQFGKWASVFGASFHLVYIMIWTWLAIFLPSDGNFYNPPSKFWWRIILEFLGCMMTLYFILKQIWEVKTQRKDQRTYKSWRVRELERDLEYCHPRWPDERQYLESEIKRIQCAKTSYFKDAWNIMDWLTYIAVLAVIITRVLAVFSNEKAASNLHPRVYALALIFMWLHFMKSCRPFKSLGPFITMLGHVMQDTLRFAFLFFEFFIPYVCAFWIIFGGEKNAQKMEAASAESVDWKKFNDLTFSVWMVTLIADFNFDGLVAVDKLMAQVLVGSYFAIASVVCMNLYIALLSETFARVYQNALANAALLQATTILQVENALSKKRKSRSEKYIQEECSPLEVFHTSGPDGGEGGTEFNRMAHQITNRLDSLEDNLKTYTKSNVEPTHGGRKSVVQSPAHSSAANNSILADIMIRNRQIEELRTELHQIHEVLLTYLSTRMPSSGISTPETSQTSAVPNARNQNYSGMQKLKQSAPLKGDFMRRFLDQKGRSNLPTVASLPAKKSRRRKRRTGDTRGYKSECLSLSGSWEDVSQTEAESIF